MSALAPYLAEGRTAPLGATLTPEGVNFAVFSQRAEAIELCLFDADGRERRHRLHGPDDGIFHGLLPGAGAGLRYGLRAHGPYRPEHGRRFNAHKLLLDPYARGIEGTFTWDDRHLSCLSDHPHGERLPDERDNAALALKSLVLAEPGPAPGRANRPRYRPAELVLYELHVKGFSMRLPGIPDAVRGTFAALAHPRAIAHLKQLGITAVSLLPVQQCLSERQLLERGMVNYWGYNPVGFFCPDPRLCSAADAAGRIAEFRHMVHTLHANGIEVILDVVFNHSAEGDGNGPSLHFRGLDNASWYMLRPDDRSHYENHSGCGNTLRLAHPRVAQFVLDVLRYWVLQMGVDGFRFDLASVLGRTRHGFDASAPFFTALRQDPLLADVHWIAEPWDAGAGGYQLGRFPGRFQEWNDRFRDSVRGYWLGQGVSRGEFARRVTGSSDVFQHAGRKPTAGINFVAAHDGFTLADVVAYSHKHNAANGEHNRDGHAHEICANFGIEGDTADPDIMQARLRTRRAMLATTLLAQGTPMLCAGDEFGNSQAGNNNAYCQDNATGWLDWSGLDSDAGTVRLVSRLIELRRKHPLLRYPHWFSGQDDADGGAQLHWYTAQGTRMTIHDWHDQHDPVFACQVQSGDAAPDACVVFNPQPESRRVQLANGAWRVLLDSSDPDASQVTDGVSECLVPARSVLLLARPINPLELSP